MKDDNYITIQGWMINRLKLSGNDLLIYAIIYGFSQAKDHWFKGRKQYLCDACNCSPSTAKRTLKNLMQNGLIYQKKELVGGVTFYHYQAIGQNDPPYVNKTFSVGQNEPTPPGHNDPHYNTSLDNTINNPSEEQKNYEISVDEGSTMSEEEVRKFINPDDYTTQLALKSSGLPIDRMDEMIDLYVVAVADQVEFNGSEKLVRARFKKYVKNAAININRRGNFSQPKKKEDVEDWYK